MRLNRVLLRGRSWSQVNSPKKDRNNVDYANPNPNLSIMLLNWLMTKPNFSFYWYLPRSSHLWLSSRHLNAVSCAKTRALFFVCLFVGFVCLFVVFFLLCFVFYPLTLPTNQLENCIEQSRSHWEDEKMLNKPYSKGHWENFSSKQLQTKHMHTHKMKILLGKNNIDTDSTSTKCKNTL